MHQGTLPATVDALDLFSTVQDRPFPFLLESAANGRYSFAGSDPFAVLLAKRNQIRLWRNETETVWLGDPFLALRQLLHQYRADSPIAVGWFGYDLGEQIEQLPRQAEDDLDFPDLYLGFYDRYVILDHESGLHRKVDETREAKRAILPEDYRERFPGQSRAIRPCTFTKENYLKAILRAKEYIAAGDIYQVNLSQRFEVPGTNPRGVYERLRTTSPAPYAAYLELGDRAILSSSPEQFLEVRDGRLWTRPIKGTRPRGDDEAEDERLRAELYASAKDDAELAMIVDLERNDLGKVCQYGTIQVEEPKKLETHPTLHHLSSTISGKLRNDVDLVDILRATFPGGSVTGAPKIRAMEIIDELEPTRRGVYTGAFGRIGLDGTAHLSIAIRMLHFDRDRFSFQVGGAIVADSDPESEHQETLIKAAGMARALGIEWNISR